MGNHPVGASGAQARRLCVGRGDIYLQGGSQPNPPRVVHIKCSSDNKCSANVAVCVGILGKAGFGRYEGSVRDTGNATALPGAWEGEDLDFPGGSSSHAHSLPGAVPAYARRPSKAPGRAPVAPPQCPSAGDCLYDHSVCGLVQCEKQDNLNIEGFKH